MIRITAISDTHSKHNELDLPGGDLLLHAGDATARGFGQEVKNFLKWFEWRDYHTVVYTPGNHDLSFEYEYETMIKPLLEEYAGVDCLIDNYLYVFDEDKDKMLKIYGSPWQPEFFDWAFNLPRNGKELKAKWDLIPEDTDILITHGPPQGILDVSGEPYNTPDLGCELLRKRVDLIKPKIHIFGHIHGSYGYKFHEGTHYINASVLNEQYKYTNKPLTFDWDQETNKIEFL